MFRIVACPTAGSCGIVPAVLAAVAEEENSTLNDVTRALFTAEPSDGLLRRMLRFRGQLAAARRNAAQRRRWLRLRQWIYSMVRQRKWERYGAGDENILGLACDPVAGLVEVPCVKRNGFHAVHALVAVEMAMMGIRSVIPPDDVIDAMGRIGRLMPVSFVKPALQVLP